MDFEELERIDGLVQDGAWVRPVRGLPPAVTLKVRGATCVQAETVGADYWTNATPEQRQSATFNEELATEVYVKAILLDWRGITEEFNEENVRRYLANRTFRNALETASQVVGRLGQKSLEDDAGN